MPRLPTLFFFSFLLAFALSLTPSAPTLHRRAYHSRAITDCSEGRSEHALGGNHADWVFQESFCVPDSAWASLRYYRKFRITCRAPGALSMLQGPVPWHQEAYAISSCDATQICVDGPYTPPDPAMMAQHAWYKRHGTAHCVDQQRFVHLSEDGLPGVGAAGGGAGVAGH